MRVREVIGPFTFYQSWEPNVPTFQYSNIPTFHWSKGMEFFLSANDEKVGRFGLANIQMTL